MLVLFAGLRVIASFSPMATEPSRRIFVSLGGESPRVGRRVSSVLLMLSGAFSGAWLLSRDLAWTLVGSVIGVATAWVIAAEQPPR
jgi:hypothetical protein